MKFVSPAHTSQDKLAKSHPVMQTGTYRQRDLQSLTARRNKELKQGNIIRANLQFVRDFTGTLVLRL